MATAAPILIPVESRTAVALELPPVDNVVLLVSPHEIEKMRKKAAKKRLYNRALELRDQHRRRLEALPPDVRAEVDYFVESERLIQSNFLVHGHEGCSPYFVSRARADSATCST